MNRMQEDLMPIEVFAPTVIADGADNNTRRIGFNDFRRIMFYVGVTAEERNSIRSAEIVRINLMQAEQLSGGATDELKEEIDIVGGVDANEALLWLEGHDHTTDDTVTVNGVVFERTDDGYHATDRPLEWETPAELVSAINGQDLGVTAQAPEGTHGVRIQADDPSLTLITVAEDIDAGTAYAATTKAGVLVECHVAELEDDNEYVFCHIDNDVTANDDIEAYAVAFKSLPYISPCKQVVADKG